MPGGRVHNRHRVAILISLTLLPLAVQGRWEEQASDLPEWAQRGRMIFIRWDEKAELLPEFEQWKPVLHLHGARFPGTRVEECVKKNIPLSLRLEAVMFFGDDRAIQKINERAYYGWREHSWFWQYNWWVRDPVFREAALIKRDGEQLIEYVGNQVTEREMGNPLHSALFRMRQEISQAVLTPHDARSPTNAIYLKFPYTAYDDTHYGKKGEPFEYYPVFGHLSMLWYDNPNLWADASEHSQKIWREHFQKKFGEEIADPPSDTREEVRHEWTRFWVDAYGKYLAAYYAAHQENAEKSAAPETATALNGKRHIAVGINASPVAKPWGAQMLYLFRHHRATSFPGLLVEYEAPFTRGKYAPMIKFSMAAMHGRQTGWSGTDQTAEAEALALNGVNAYTALTPRAKAYIQFRYDNRALFTNALQGNRVGIVYNVRTGLHSNTLISAYELGQQLDELGIPYDVITEDDLVTPDYEFMKDHLALLVPGGEFNESEIKGLSYYVVWGGNLVLIGDVFQESKTEKPSPIGRPTALQSKGHGSVTLCDDQMLTNKRIEEILHYRIESSYQVMNPQGGLICANVLLQPRQRNARIIGLVNYTGQPQSNIKISLPRESRFTSAVAVSPDGIAAPITISDPYAYNRPSLILPELHSYAAIILGEPSVLEAALPTVKPRVAELRAAREPLKRTDSITYPTLKPEDVPADQRLARLRHGTFETATFIVMDALAPRKARVNEPIRVAMHLRYNKFGTMEYWRVRAVHVETGEEVRTKPPGAKDPIDGVGVQQLDGDKPVPMGYITDKLIGKTFVADFSIAKPGRYQLSLDYLYVNPFLHGEPAPRIESAFLGDRPEAGWDMPTKPFRKHYLRHKFPGLVIEVTP